MSQFARQFAPHYERWRDDIRVFAAEGMNFEATWQQEELFDLVQMETLLPESKRLKRIAVRSGQGPGKTAASCIVALWRCLRYEDALCIVTSPSMRQCKQWIDECRRLLKNSHPFLQRFIETFDTKVQINGSKMWEIRTATATRPENLQGIHEKRLTFIADEGSGVSRAIFETIKGTLSNPDALFLTIGNPNTTDCTFYDCFTQHADEWHKLCWNAEDTARDYPEHLSPTRNLQLAKEYGRDSDVYRVRVLGEFPHQNPNSVMALSDIMACTKTSKVGCAGIRGIIGQMRAIGIDYARFGSDESSVFQRQGLAIINWKVFVKTDPREVTDYAFRLQYDSGWPSQDTWYLPDAGGIGQGIMHSFGEAGKNALEFYTQARAADSSMFADQYSEAWWCLRQMIREHICHIPNDPRLIKQLSTREYYMDNKGRIKVETKDEWRKRTETSESPDRADGLVYAFYPCIGEGGGVFAMQGNKHVVGTKIQRKR